MATDAESDQERRRRAKAGVRFTAINAVMIVHCTCQVGVFFLTDKHSRTVDWMTVLFYCKYRLLLPTWAQSGKGQGEPRTPERSAWNAKKIDINITNLQLHKVREWCWIMHKHIYLINSCFQYRTPGILHNDFCKNALRSVLRSLKVQKYGSNLCKMMSHKSAFVQNHNSLKLWPFRSAQSFQSFAVSASMSAGQEQVMCTWRINHVPLVKQ